MNFNQAPNYFPKLFFVKLLFQRKNLLSKVYCVLIATNKSATIANNAMAQYLLIPHKLDTSNKPNTAV